MDLDLAFWNRTWTRTWTCPLKVDLDLDLDLRIVDLDLHLDLAVPGLVTSLLVGKSSDLEVYSFANWEPMQVE